MRHKKRRDLRVKHNSLFVYNYVRGIRRIRSPFLELLVSELGTHCYGSETLRSLARWNREPDLCLHETNSISEPALEKISLARSFTATVLPNSHFDRRTLSCRER